MAEFDREQSYYYKNLQYSLDGEDFNLIPHNNDDNSIVIGIRDNEDISIKEHIIASIFTYHNQSNFYDELNVANFNLKNLNSIKKDYPYFQNVAGLTDCMNKCNIVLRVFFDEYKDIFSVSDKYVYATLIRNLSSFRASLSLVYHSSEFAMMATLRQAYEQIGFCSYIVNNGIDVSSKKIKNPNKTVKEMNNVIPNLNSLYGELSDKTHINYEQFSLYFDKDSDEVIERSLINLAKFINFFGKISEAQISMIDIFLKKFKSSDIWYRTKIREHWAYHNAIRTALGKMIRGESESFSLANICEESSKLPPL